MTRLDDPVVRREYADESRLRARARIYGRREPATPDAHQVALDALAELEPRRILEVGCGWGEFAERIQRDLHVDLLALDLSPRMVELAKERGIDARLGDVQDLPFEDGAFDGAVAAWMLYHVPDLDRGLAELARVLRPRGRLVAITISESHLEELFGLLGAERRGLIFSRENGVDALRRHFRSIRRDDVEGTVLFRSRREVAEYVAASMTLKPLAENLPSGIEEPFRARRSVSVFVADK